MKVIFLDIDGVLNSSSWYAANLDKDMSNHFNHLDPECIQRLNKITEATGANIVITSVWRKNYPIGQIAAWLRELGCNARVLGATPGSASGIRGEEIQTWMDTSRHAKDIESFVIIDDSSDMAHLIHRLVRTSHYGGGLADEHAKIAISMLNEES